MGGQLQLEELASQLEQELGIPLSSKPTSDSACSYWATGTDGSYVIDHTVTPKGFGMYVIEEITVTRHTENGCKKETWDAAALTEKDKIRLSLHYHTQRANAEEYKQKMKQVSPNGRLQRFKDAMKAEFELVTNAGYLEAEQEGRAGTPVNECLDINLEGASMDELKALPELLKEFYR